MAAEPVLRHARRHDESAIEGLMRTSIAQIFPAFYDERQTASSVVHIGQIDRLLIDDGTYFVVEVASEIVACGGWSKRDKLYTGSSDQEDGAKARYLDPAIEAARVRAMFVRPDWTRKGLGTRILEACEQAARAAGFGRLELMATLPGVGLYSHYGFRETRRTDIQLPDGIRLACAAMEKQIAGPPGTSKAQAAHRGISQAAD